MQIALMGQEVLVAIADQHHGVLTSGLALERGIGQAALRAEGFEVVRIRYGDLILRPEAEMTRLRRALTTRTCGG
jgi:hypothetical protein